MFLTGIQLFPDPGHLVRISRQLLSQLRQLGQLFIQTLYFSKQQLFSLGEFGQGQCLMLFEQGELLFQNALHLAEVFILGVQ